MKKLIALMWLALSAPAFGQASVFVPATTNQISLPGTVASITRIITAQPGKSIYITGLMLVPVATSVVRFSYGTGTNCNTGTGVLAGDLTFATAGPLTYGDGYGAIFVVPQGNDLCITITTAAAPGSLAYAIF